MNLFLAGFFLGIGFSGLVIFGVAFLGAMLWREQVGQ
jgi:hypothetical protein